MLVDIFIKSKLSFECMFKLLEATTNRMQVVSIFFKCWGANIIT